MADSRLGRKLLEQFLVLLDVSCTRKGEEGLHDLTGGLNLGDTETGLAQKRKQKCLELAAGTQAWTSRFRRQ